jgi:hypothetical protein
MDAFVIDAVPFELFGYRLFVYEHSFPHTAQRADGIVPFHTTDGKRRMIDIGPIIMAGFCQA